MGDIKYPLPEAHTMSQDDVASSLQTNLQSGLAQGEADKRNTDFGLNEYKAQKQKSVGLILLHQFQSPIVYLLLFGAGVSFYFKDIPEAVAILIVIFLNALLGFFMELQARNSMNALKKMDVILTKVIRDGKTAEIPSEKLTPGDILIFEAGNIIAGDARLFEINQLQCDESSLTGESLPTDKNLDPLSKEAPLGDRHNMVFKGSSVIKGNGKAIVTGIASDTQLGTITSLVEKSEETSTPLDKKLNALSKKLILVTLLFIAIFAVTGFIQGKKLVMVLETSIALAVAAIPEGLPIVATIALAYGMVLMAKRNAIVKQLSSVETLGGTSVILTDKTGTLTENKIHVNTIAFPSEKIGVQIDNNALKFPSGEIQKSKNNFEALLTVGVLCNDANIHGTEENKKETGDPIEVSMLHLAEAAGKSIDEIKKQYKRVGEMPFSSETKTMGTLHDKESGQFVAAKGSVEHLLKNCSQILIEDNKQELNDEKRGNLMNESEKMAAEGLRVIAFAFKDGQNLPKDQFMNDLVFAGMIGFLDPPREDIKPSIASCREAGIKIVMITGDHPMTALNIARKVGLVEESEQNVLEGKDIPSIENIQQDTKDKILNTAVFARVTPKQKLDIAEIYQKEGNIVAMTGDGVNDAPALKKADVGIAMGLRGTQVAKETANIILKDDSFTSIAEAVEHGRAIFTNIQKFVVYLISCNLSEIFIVTILGFLAPASTLLPLQILFLNMITDVFPALALGMSKGDEGIMKKPPRDPKSGIINNRQWFIMVLYSVIMTLAIAGGVLYYEKFVAPDTKMMNNIAFLSLFFTQLFHVFNMSSPKTSLLNNDITRNIFVWLALVLCTGLTFAAYLIPVTNKILGFEELSFNLLAICLVVSAIPLVVIQILKRFIRTE